MCDICRPRFDAFVFFFIRAGLFFSCCDDAEFPYPICLFEKIVLFSSPLSLRCSSRSRRCVRRFFSPVKGGGGSLAAASFEASSFCRRPFCLRSPLSLAAPFSIFRAPAQSWPVLAISRFFAIHFSSDCRASFLFFGVLTFFSPVPLGVSSIGLVLKLRFPRSPGNDDVISSALLLLLVVLVVARLLAYLFLSLLFDLVRPLAFVFGDEDLDRPMVSVSVALFYCNFCFCRG